MLKLPLDNTKGLIIKGDILLDIRFPEDEEIQQFLMAILVHKRKVGTCVYLIDMYNFIYVGTHNTEFDKNCYISYFDAEYISIKNKDSYSWDTSLQNVYFPNILGSNHDLIGNRT